MDLRKTLVAAAASLGVAGAAHAEPIVGQISIGGFVEAIGSTSVGAATGLDFVQSGMSGASVGTAGGLTMVGAGTGSFAGLNCGSVGGSCGSLRDLPSFSAAGPIASFLTITAGQSATISFDLASITSVIRNDADSDDSSLTVSAAGTINYTGLDSTAGTFTLTTQGSSIVSFSATALAAETPISEPGSLVILGGSLAAIGLIRLKKA